MTGKRLAGIGCALLLWLNGVSVAAQAGQVLYDEGGGEKLEDLLAEDAAAWPTVATPAEAEGLNIRAKGAVLMDQGSGTVLYEKDGRKRLPIASVTKVMTLLLVMEAIDEGRLTWEETVTCSDKAASMGGSQIWLEPGEIMTVEELVKAAAVVSANDACAALAEHLSGTLEAFVAAMNTRAAELGMTDTHFVDCSGLDDSGYSCATDVAIMSRQLMCHPAIQKYTTIWMDSLRGGKSQLVNTNKLVRHYKGATGLKTGTTNAAGHCLAATAQRENTAFVAVVLGCDTTADRFDGARALLDYGFAGYTAFTPPTAEAKPAPVKVLRGQMPTVEVRVDTPSALLLKKGAEGQIAFVTELAADVQAPVHKGQVLGTWRVMLGEEILGEYPIRAACEVLCVTFRWAYGLLLGCLLQ
ncbi:MAG: D-alanyl-D-alanine carboxypeptidase [Clostridia bacterium]|nr:D-alanyl-D-alanine carboxypeptidase [Clostridia bacterium]